MKNRISDNFIAFKKLVLFIICCFCIEEGVQAAIYTFVGGQGNNEWTNSGNRVVGQYPGLEAQVGDDVFIDAGVNCFINDHVIIHGSLVNQGLIQLVEAPPFFGRLTIHGSLTNQAGIEIQVKFYPLDVKPGATVLNAGLIKVTSDELSLPEINVEGDFVNTADGWLQIRDGDLEVSGSFINEGDVTIDDAFYENFQYSEVVIEGTFENRAGGSLGYSR